MKNNLVHRTSQQFHALLHSFILIGGTILTIVMFMVLGPITETRYFPVISNVKANLIKIEGEKMIFEVLGNRTRNCSLNEAHILIDKKDGKPPIRGAIWVIDEQYKVKKYLGYQSLGQWSVIPVGKVLEVEATFSCPGIPWETKTTLGVWKV